MRNVEPRAHSQLPVLADDDADLRPCFDVPETRARAGKDIRQPGTLDRDSLVGRELADLSAAPGRKPDQLSGDGDSTSAGS